MKISFEKRKSAKPLTSIIQNTTDFGKKLSSSVKNTVTMLSEKAKNDNYIYKMKKYNPVFPDQYTSSVFTLPNMIMIVDDAVRRNIDVCQGAIGWLGKEKDIEILYLYDEAVSFSGLQFIPSANCNAVYYVDSFDRKRFIRVDCIFSKAHEERLAELKHIAYCLGAKRCSIEISEASTNTQEQNKSFDFSKKLGYIEDTDTLEQNVSSTTSSKRCGQIEVEFEGSSTPQMPKLKWFANDDTINRLIDARCNGDNLIKVETIKLAGSSCSTLDQKTAYSIDCTLSAIGSNKGGISLDTQAHKEHYSELLFRIEF